MPEEKMPIVLIFGLMPLLHAIRKHEKQIYTQFQENFCRGLTWSKSNHWEVTMWLTSHLTNANNDIVR